MLGNPNNFSSDNRFSVEGEEVVFKNVGTPANQEEFDPKWEHIQEDLKYLFQINTENEEDLKSQSTKDLMYQKVIDSLRDNSPFTFDYFFEEKLLTKDDIKPEDREELAVHARAIIEGMKYSPQRTRIEQLFIDARIF